MAAFPLKSHEYFDLLRRGTTGSCGKRLFQS
jgi:hypothetical protein